ncbi:hypothetical protein ONZ45_g18327 [Pleurotus djamor]|nr:hypothetical protein ONZ45_g18327 [Pleurotus djamor]
MAANIVQEMHGLLQQLTSNDTNQLKAAATEDGSISPATITDAVDYNETTTDPTPVPSLGIPAPTTPTPADSGLPSVKSDDGYFAIPIGCTTTTSGAFPLSAALSALATPLLDESVEPMKTEADIALESQYTWLKLQHEEQRRIWEWYLRKNSDDFVVEKYQCISMWEYTVPMADFGLHRACFPPQLTYITFYGENDLTLGQFIDKSITDTLTQFLDPKAFLSTMKLVSTLLSSNGMGKSALTILQLPI